MPRLRLEHAGCSVWNGASPRRSAVQRAATMSDAGVPRGADRAHLARAEQVGQRGRCATRPTAPAARALRSDPAGVNAQVALLVMIETATGLENAAEIAAVPGVDGIFVGPADLAISMGLPPGVTAPAPGVEDALDKVAGICAEHGIVAGLAGGAEYARRGFRVLTVADDRALLSAGRSTVDAARRSTRPARGGARAGPSDASPGGSGRRSPFPVPGVRIPHRQRQHRRSSRALASTPLRGGSSAGQSSGLIIRQVVGSSPTRPTT
jgi:hypothetical protein